MLCFVSFFLFSYYLFQVYGTLTYPPPSSFAVCLGKTKKSEFIFTKRSTMDIKIALSTRCSMCGGGGSCVYKISNGEEAENDDEMQCFVLSHLNLNTKNNKNKKINLITFRHPLTYTRKNNNNYNKILQQHSFEIRKIPKNFKIKKIIKKIIDSSIPMIPAHKKEDGLCRTKNNRKVTKEEKRR